MSTPFKDRLEIVTNVLIIVALLLLGGTYLKSRFTHADLGPLVGDKIDAPRGYDWHNRPETLVVAVRKGCVFCERSYPLYRRLDALERDSHLKAHMLIVMPDDAATGAALLSSETLSCESITNMPLSGIRVSGTPTLLLVDANGRLLQSWVGELDASTAEALVAQLRR